MTQKSTLKIEIEVPAEEVGSYIMDLQGKGMAYRISPSSGSPMGPSQVNRKAQSPGPRLVTPSKKPKGSKVQAPKGERTSDYAEKLFLDAKDGVVTRATIADKFTSLGFNGKSAQTLLDRWVAQKKITKLEPGVYRWLGVHKSTDGDAINHALHKTG